MLEKRDPGEVLHRVSEKALDLRREPELQRTPAEIEPDVISDASIIERRGSFRLIRVKGRGVASHQASPAQELGALAERRPWDPRRTTQVETLHRMRLLSTQKRRLHGSQRRDEISHPLLPGKARQLEVTPTENGPGAVQPVAGAPFTPRAASDRVSRLIEAHLMTHSRQLGRS